MLVGLLSHTSRSNLDSVTSRSSAIEMKAKKVHKSNGSKVSITSVPTFICPDVMLPESFKKKASNYKGRDDKGTKKKEEEADFESMFSSVRELGSSQLVGLARKKHKEDKLTKLGAYPAKQPTMPFAQKMGILAGRKKREGRAVEAAKQSGVVLARKSKQGGGERERVKKDRGFDVHTKRGVLHLKRDMASSSGGSGGKRR